MDNERRDKFTLTEQDAQFAQHLINEYENHIKAAVYSALGAENRYLAEDAISEVCLLICEKIETLKGHTCPKAWILIAAKNISQNLKRKHRADSLTVPIEEDMLSSSGEDVLEEALFNIWVEEKVPEKIISKLTPREKEIYRKLYIENKTPNDIAGELNISAGSVRNIHKNLRDKIHDFVKRKDF